MLGRLAFLFGFEWLGSKTWHGVFDGFGNAVGMVVVGCPAAIISFFGYRPLDERLLE